MDVGIGHGNQMSQPWILAINIYFHAVTCENGYLGTSQIVTLEVSIKEGFFWLIEIL